MRSGSPRAPEDDADDATVAVVGALLSDLAEGPRYVAHQVTWVLGRPAWMESDRERRPQRGQRARGAGSAGNGAWSPVWYQYATVLMSSVRSNSPWSQAPICCRVTLSASSK